jgi:sodium/potassium-transporting ATPase subunit alpha
VVYNKTIHDTAITPQMAGDNFTRVDPADPHMQTLLRVAALNTDAVFLSKHIDGKDENELEPDVLKWTTKGDASESGIIKFVQPFLDLATVRGANQRLHSIPFNSTNKWMLTISEQAPRDGLTSDQLPLLMGFKGASERVMNYCSTALIEGQVVPFTPEMRLEFEDLNKQLAKRGERVLALAYRDLSREEFPPGYKFDTEVRSLSLAQFVICLYVYVSVSMSLSLSVFYLCLYVYLIACPLITDHSDST